MKYQHFFKFTEKWNTKIKDGYHEQDQFLTYTDKKI